MTKNASTLPQFVRDLLATVPRSGNGVHRWLFRVARHLHAHLPAGAIVTLLEMPFHIAVAMFRTQRL